MMWSTAAISRLGIRVPVIQAPLGGGPSTVELAAAVCNAGGLGTIAGGYLTAATLREQIRALRKLTDRPFAVNLFVPEPAEPDPAEPDPAVLDGARQLLSRYREEVGLPPDRRSGPWAEDFDEQFGVVVDERIPVFSFTFGLLPGDGVDRLHGVGTVVMGTATNVREATALASSGVDLLCAQGAEAGGHHGTWIGSARDSVIGTMALVPLVCDAVAVPVVAAGGIMDGRGVAAALCLGAGAAQMGTAFMLCPEAGTRVPHRRAMTSADETSVALTSTVTGKLARGVRNRLMTELEGATVPPYPVMNRLTSDLRKASADRTIRN
jgi:nitronate monooxygenase